MLGSAPSRYRNKKVFLHSFPFISDDNMIYNFFVACVWLCMIRKLLHFPVFFSCRRFKWSKSKRENDKKKEKW